ncbi:HAD-IA family hydrolase [Amaricoccus sp.]|uniref:HAD-IA family hydrolase n=1 Tax=Amaricoccus sp. TaxID=1872485 RepID=UPI00261A09A9|nr:HAD-IA family hydrolase [Amaricoccus sp.]HRO12899.1 HAD-IA family hydrolase [Amaricoccus sp.]
MSGLELVVFDVDGTLVDSQHHILAAMRFAFGRAGLPLPARETALGVVGLSLPQAMAALVPHLAPAEVEAIVADYRASFTEERARGQGVPPLYPGARAALERLAARPETLIGVATGKARRGLDHILAGHGLAHFVVTAQTADDHPSKPHPSMLLRALAETGVEAGRAVMVGDTEFDIAMGRAAGMATVGVAWGYHARARLAAADAIIESFDALDGALDGALARLAERRR